MNANVGFYRSVIEEFGERPIVWRLVRECGDLWLAVSMFWRGSSSRKDVITVLAELHITLELVACIFGRDDFEVEIERKLQELREHISKRGAV